jgi:hypothetical protein
MSRWRALGSYRKECADEAANRNRKYATSAKKRHFVFGGPAPEVDAAAY